MAETTGRKDLFEPRCCFWEDSGTGATGAVIRDSNGVYIAAAQKYLAHVVDTPTAEACALRDGLVQQVGCNRIVIQSDCLEVVETMKKWWLLHNFGSCDLWRLLWNMEWLCRDFHQLRCMKIVMNYGMTLQRFPSSTIIGKGLKWHTI